MLRHRQERLTLPEPPQPAVRRRQGAQNAKAKRRGGPAAGQSRSTAGASTRLVHVRYLQDTPRAGLDVSPAASGPSRETSGHPQHALIRHRWGQRGTVWCPVGGLRHTRKQKAGARGSNNVRRCGICLRRKRPATRRHGTLVRPIMGCLLHGLAGPLMSWGYFGDEGLVCAV